MALIKCTDCNADVSDAAPACPRCGRPIASAPSYAQPYWPPGKPPSNTFANVLWGLVGFAVMLMAIAWIYGNATSGSDLSDARPQAPATQTPRSSKARKIDELLSQMDQAAERQLAKAAQPSTPAPSAEAIAAQFDPAIALQDDCATEDAFSWNVANNREAGRSRDQEKDRFSTAPIGPLPFDRARAKADRDDIDFVFDHPALTPSAIGDAVNQACMKRGANPSDYAGKRPDRFDG